MEVLHKYALVKNLVDGADIVYFSLGLFCTHNWTQVVKIISKQQCSAVKIE